MKCKHNREHCYECHSEEATIKRVADAIEAEFMNPLNLKLSEDDLRVKFAKAAIAAYETK